MIECNVCGEKIEKCDYCGEEFKPRDNLKCFTVREEDIWKNYHFCSKECWKSWFEEEYSGNLEEAEATEVVH